jgi:hypothetical protein
MNTTAQPLKDRYSAPRWWSKVCDFIRYSILNRIVGCHHQVVIIEVSPLLLGHRDMPSQDGHQVLIRYNRSVCQGLKDAGWCPLYRAGDNMVDQERCLCIDPLIGRIRTMVVKSMTIGIELTLTTTPGNGHQLAPIGRLTVQSKFPSPLGLILWIPVISSPIRTELSFQDFRIARHAFRICLVPKPAKYNLTSRLKSPVTRARFQTR